MSAAASPAPSDSENRKKEVAFRFCQECSNLLYPKEDRSTNELLYVCRACHAVQKHDSACTFRKHYAANVQETAGVTTDVSNDPTVGVTLPDSICFCTMCGEQLKCTKCGKKELPRAKQTCPRCKEPDAVYFQSQQRAADTGMKLYYVCTTCNHVYTTV